MPNIYSEQEQQLWMDKVAIRELIDRYFFGEGRLDVDTILSCFTPDATFGEAVGHDGIRAIMDGISYFKACYVIGASQQITVNGDMADADTQAVGFALRTDGGGSDRPGRIMVQGVRYKDHLVRTAEGWRIKARCGFDDPSKGHDTPWQFDTISVPVHLD
jgi:hypothetical protein